MQAQIEPHFLFNTLASVQYLVETDPPQATKMLGYLLAYLRAALPQLRVPATTLGKEIELAEAYLNILRMRMGERLAFAVEFPIRCARMPVAADAADDGDRKCVEHGLEPQAEGGSVRLEARRSGDTLVVVVTDTGRGLAAGNRREAGTRRRRREPARAPGRAVRRARPVHARGSGAARRARDDRGAVRGAANE